MKTLSSLFEAKDQFDLTWIRAEDPARAFLQQLGLKGKALDKAKDLRGYNYLNQKCEVYVYVGGDLKKLAYWLLFVLDGARYLANKAGLQKEEIIAATIIDKLETFVEAAVSLRGYTDGLSELGSFDWNRFANTNAGAIMTRYAGNPANKDKIRWKHIPDILDAYFTYVKKLKLDKHFKVHKPVDIDFYHTVYMDKLHDYGYNS